MKSQKEEYLRNEFWILSIGAAFQRANIYGKATDNQKTSFKKALFDYVDELSEQYVHKGLAEDIHLDNIEKLKERAILIANELAMKLKGDNFRFGIAQKLLNLYLKYLWCAGYIKEPPHFPVDRIIIQSLESASKTNWTELDDVKEYRWIIELAREEAGNNLAKWELENYRRR